MDKKDQIKIVGISLIKNEDQYIERVLKNVIDFCDEIIVLDNFSTDNTFKIVENLAQQYQKIKLSKLKDPLKSHKYIEKYANTNTWILGVDGDEIFDPNGLKKLRLEILSSKYQEYWRLVSNSLHCEKIDLESNTATGYLAPPLKSIVIYNFSVLKSWKEDNSQRLHGRNLIFKNGFNKSREFKLYKKYNWENSHFRCLHVCFLKRSSLDLEKNRLTRLNIAESHKKSKIILNFFRNLLKERMSFGQLLQT